MLKRFFTFRTFKRLTLLSFLAIALAAVSIWGSDAMVKKAAQGRCYDDVANLPENRVALVLGTIKQTGRGTVNLYFKYRMQAAAELYHAGKVSHLLVSGDNHVKGYDEPSDMRDYLISLGVPANAISLDYAGFRTLDSVVRAREIFGQNSITIVSQQFHNERALFLAKQHGIEAVAYNARAVPIQYHKIGPVRERLARAKAVLDVYVLGTDPKFLGEPVSI